MKNAGEAEATAVRKKVMEIPSHPEYEAEIKEFVLKNGGAEYSSSCLDGFVRKAVEAIGVLPDSKEKDYLVAIAGFTAKRDR